MHKKNNFIKIFFFISFFLFLSAPLGYSVSENNDGSLSKSIMEIAIELKCLECEGQNVYESNSNFSQSIKAYIRKELTRGTDSRDIINDLHQKYGDEILMTPPVQTNTYVLWILPFFLLSLGFFIFFCKLKK
ncbi:MAG: cytochrome c-type biogenesis protein [Pseudomonadota bacterium]|nr:cytochrome c-type biogenesis protein [Pseudomonadota bacterium]